MANQNHKRKLEETFRPTTLSMPRQKRRDAIGTFPRNNVIHQGFPAHGPNDAIEIKDEGEDDSFPQIKQSIPSTHTESRGDLRGLMIAVSNYEEEIKQTRQIEKALRDQIADWSLTTQRLEALIAELSNAVNDTTALDNFKETVLRMIPDNTQNEEKFEDIRKRLDKLEGHHRYRGKEPAFALFSREALAEVAPSLNIFEATSSRKDDVLLNSRSLTKPEITLGPARESSLSERKPASTATKAASTASSTTISLSFTIPPAISQLGLSEADWAAPAPVPALSNGGLEKLLRNVDFSNPAHLRALAELDSRDHPRDVILFCDSHTFSMFRVDYVIVGGRIGSYIVDHPSCGRGSLGKAGLGRLRALELDFVPLHGITGPAGSRGGPVGGAGGGSSSTASNGSRGNNNKDNKNSNSNSSNSNGDEEAGIRAWKARVGPPAYVYELGQLFLRRKGQDRFDAHPTQYNVVVDMAGPGKGVWLVMRPEHPCAASWRKDSKDSTVPFRTNMVSFNGVAAGRFAARLADLSFATPPFSFESRDTFYDAEAGVRDTAYKGKVRLQFRAPDYEHMMRTLAVGWGKARGETSCTQSE